MVTCHYFTSSMQTAAVKSIQCSHAVNTTEGGFQNNKIHIYNNK